MVSKSRNKIHQTWEALFWRSLYAIFSSKMLSRSSSAYQKLDVSSAEGASAAAGSGGMETDDAVAGAHEMTSIAVIR